MGGVKQRQLELESRSMNEPKDTFVCSSHIDDYAILDFIESEGVRGTCTYCNSISKVVELEDLMIFVMDGISKFYEDAAGFMGFSTGEGGYMGETYDGEELLYHVIGLEVDNYELSKDMADSIDDRAWSSPDDYFGSINDLLISQWKYFKKIVKHKSRYLFTQISDFKNLDYTNKNASDILYDIGRSIKSLRLKTIIKKGTLLYRCRQHAKKEIIKIANQIASPPEHLAIYPNRMSPAGISMFYCAFDPNTSFKETVDRTSKKKYVTTGCFSNMYDLLLIDLTKLPKVPSIFDYKNIKNYYTIKFLIDFVKDLTRDISRDGKEHIEYVPTQIVTEFLQYINFKGSKKQLDGIIYPSSKNKGEKACVLFMDNETSLAKLEFIPSSLLRQRL